MLKTITTLENKITKRKKNGETEKARRRKKKTMYKVNGKTR